MRSAARTVERRCATTRVVRSRMSRSSASRTTPSASGSRALVASSRKRMRGSRTSARAIAMRWRCPPDSRAPRCPTTVSQPSGRASTNSSALASRRAARTRTSVAAGSSPAVSSPYATFSRIVPSKSTDSCGTTDTHRRTVRRSSAAMSAPSSRRRPDVGRTNPRTRLRSVDLPDPDGPTKATVSPSRTSRSTSCSASSEASGYRCETCSSRRCPRTPSTWRRPSLRSRSGSASTSAIDRTDSTPRAVTGTRLSTWVRPWVRRPK